MLVMVHQPSIRRFLQILRCVELQRLLQLEERYPWACMKGTIKSRQRRNNELNCDSLT